jgi:RNA-directed DNA polymerase
LRQQLEQRLSNYGMQLHEGKTKILLCGVRPAKACKARNERMPTFTFLGFLHVWGESVNRKTGHKFPRLMRRTCPKRYRAKLAEIESYLRKHRHDKQILKTMKRVAQGCLNYFAINDNSRRIKMFVHSVTRKIHKWLCRRSQKKNLNWEAFQIVLQRCEFPEPKILHNLFFNSSAFSNAVPMRKPDALIGQVRF